MHFDNVYMMFQLRLMCFTSSKSMFLFSKNHFVNWLFQRHVQQSVHHWNKRPWPQPTMEVQRVYPSRKRSGVKKRESRSKCSRVYNTEKLNKLVYTDLGWFESYDKRKDIRKGMDWQKKNDNYKILHPLFKQITL